MKPILQFVLLIFGVCLVIHLSVSKICGGEEYTVVYPNDTFKRCLPCGKCLPGLGLKPVCGSTLHHPPSTIDCHACKPGEFSSEFDSSPCLACHQCLKYESITAHCTNKSDTVCSGKCEEGYYLSKTAPHNCQKCSSCCLDGKDEKIPECINQAGLSKHCTCSARPDKVCGESCPSDASKGGSLSTTTTIILIGGLSAVVIAILSIVTVVYYRRKRNGRQSQQPEVPAAIEQSNGSACYAIEGPQTEFSATIQNPLYQGTPVAERSMSPHASKHNASQQQSDSINNAAVVSFKEEVNFPEEKRSVRPTLSRQDIQDSQTSASKLDASPQQSDSLKKAGVVSFDEQVKLPEEKGSAKPSLSRQESQESQTSGDGDPKFRKRSGSAISFEKLKRKLSERDDSLIEEDSDEEREPIKIIKQPKSQTAKEGSKVELKCKVQGKCSRLLYQWFKDDGSAMLGQNGDSLVLESVELRDFGRYKCHVTYNDNFGEGKTSSPAKLDVIPQNQNGMRLKLLQEVDINTRDEVASLLENKRFSLGGCRQVAARYGMKDHQIEALNNIKDPGQDVLGFLEGSKPNLTVYDFCKVLKEDKIDRFDIVKKLEDHFLIREETQYV